MDEFEVFVFLDDVSEYDVVYKFEWELFLDVKLV